MCLSCKRDGVVSDKISNKGVLLSRRDNCPFVRKIYGDVVMMVFNKVSKVEIVNYIIDELNKMCSHFYSTENFVITKSIGDIGDLQLREGKDKNEKPCYKVGDYKVKLLPEEKESREKKFNLKDCDNEREYYLRCLPAQVQLAEKMRQRGQLVPAGTRLEYVITTKNGHTAKQYEKIESFDYFRRFNQYIELDYLYYLKLLVNPLDQILDIIFVGDDKGFMMKQYKYRFQARSKVLSSIKNLFAPKLKFEK